MIRVVILSITGDPFKLNPVDAVIVVPLKVPPTDAAPLIESDVKLVVPVTARVPPIVALPVTVKLANELPVPPIRVHSPEEDPDGTIVVTPLSSAAVPVAFQ